MSSLGDLHFVLGLDDKKFNDAIEAAKNKIKKLGADAPVGISVDTGEIAKKIREELSKAQGGKGIGSSADITVKLNEESLKLVKQQLAELGAPITTTIQVEYDTEKFQAVETAMKNFGKRVGESVNQGMGGSGKAPASTPTPKKGIMGWIDKVADTLMGEESGGGGTSAGSSGNLSSTLAGLNEQLAKLSENVDSINKKSSGRKKTAIVGEGEEMKRYLSQLQRLEEGVRRWQYVRASLERSKVDKDSGNYRNAIALIDAYIEKLEQAQQSAGKFTGREMAEMLGQNLSGEVAKTRALVKEQKELENLKKAADKKDETTAKNDFKRQQGQLKNMEESVRRIQNVKARVNAIDIDKSSDNYRQAMAILDGYIDKLEEAKKKAGSFTGRGMAELTGQNLTGEIAEANRLIAEQRKLEREAKGGNKSAVQQQKEALALKKAELQVEKEGLNVKAAKSRADKLELQKQKEVVRVKKERVSLQKKLSKGMQGLSTWANQLGTQLNNIISIYAIERFARSLYTIGGEFQKQQIALRNMIGDVAQADSTFERLKDLAVKSPFTFSDLASYTKQMSAYGIEYEELYDTTKRLADISAGVGVDMGRLILAYGQVRSAEVLRGQELRQFTEAGIPLVAELAKRLEEVRGESVKVGEVFDAISKRQVSFEMVKDVLFDMTDPGGRFFEMQEELAKSLAGQWSNLKDAWDIMIADIANSTNDVLSGAASVAADLLRSWRSWAPALVAVASAFGVVTSAIRVYNTVTAIAAAFSKASVLGITASIVLGIASAIGGWALASSLAKKNASQLNTELEAQVQKWSENRSNALRYIDALKSSNTSEERRIQLYNELLELYPSIFEKMKMEQVLLADTASLKTQVNEATKAMSIGEITKLIEEEREKIRKAEGNSVERGTFNGQEYKITRKPLTDEQKAKIARAEARIADLEKKAAKIQRNIDREGLIEKLTPDSSLEKYVEVYHNLGKAVKILRQGGIMGELSNPKEFTTRLEYYDQLTSALKEQEEISKKFKTGTPERADADKLVKVYRNAIAAIGGIWDSDKGNELSEAAKKDINAYIEALKNEIAKIGSQWSLYKDLMEASGNKTLSMNIAFGGQISFESQLEQLKSRIMDEANKFNVGIGLDELLGMGEKQLLERGIEEKAAKAIGALVDAYNKENEKLKDESVRNFIEILNASKDFEQQIADVERKLQEDLENLAANSKGMSGEEYARRRAQLVKKAEEDKTKIRFEEFKESSDWVKVFDDLDRVSDTTLDNMISKIEEFAKQARLSEEVTKQLVEAMAKLRDETIERNPFEGFKDAWNRASYWRNYDVNAAYNKQFNDKTGKFEQKLSQEQVDNNLAEANDDLKDSALAVADKFQAVANAADLLSGLFENMGLGASDFMSAISDVIGGAASGAQAGAGIAAAFGATGPWGAIAGAAVGVLSSLFAQVDKSLQRSIEESERREKEIGNVAKNLETALERNMGGIFTMKLDDKTSEAFAKVIDNFNNAQNAISDWNSGEQSWDTWEQIKEFAHLQEDTIETIQEALSEDSYFDAQLAALKIQRDEVQKQKDLEDEKKNTDKDKMLDYEQQINELDDAISHFAEDMANALYGIDFKDWSEQLAESLVDAWASGEDAVQAYRDTVNEILKDLGVSIISQKIIQPLLDKTMEDFLAQFEKDNGVLTDSSLEILAGMADQAAYAASATEAYLKGLEKLGIDLSGTSDEAKEGLSKGIQSVTEDTADLLASYVNAIRADVSVDRSLMEKLIGEDVPRLSYIAEAQLQQLNMIQQNTKRNADVATEIRDLFSRVVDKGSNKLKV